MLIGVIDLILTVVATIALPLMCKAATPMRVIDAAGFMGELISN